MNVDELDRRLTQLVGKNWRIRTMFAPCDDALQIRIVPSVYACLEITGEEMAAAETPAALFEHKMNEVKQAQRELIEALVNSLEENR